VPAGARIYVAWLPELDGDSTRLHEVLASAGGLSSACVAEGLIHERIAAVIPVLPGLPHRALELVEMRELPGGCVQSRCRPQR